MSSLPDLIDLIIQAGHDVIAIKSYSIVVLTILVYDHLLTLADEVKYAWSGKKSWTFWLFIVNRYFPMTYQFWLLATSFNSHPDAKVCDKTAWYPLFTFAVCTLLAQVVLTLRIYAVTRKNIPIVIGFAVITASQFVLGIWMSVLAGKNGAIWVPPIPADAYRLCVFVTHRNLEVAFTSISLFYDALAFSLIIFLAAQSNRETAGLKVPNILRTIAKDSTRYFLVIFTSHFVLMMTLIFARQTIQLLPAPGNVVYLPVMVSRIMLSLRKAADPHGGGWSFGDPDGNRTDLPSIKFARPQSGANPTEGGISLATYPHSQTATR